MPVPGAILQGAGEGVSRPLDFSAQMHGMQIGEERRNAQERLKLAKQSRADQESKYFDAQLDPNQLKGDISDAPVSEEMSSINADIHKRLLEGASSNQIGVEFAPRMAKVAKYQTAAKMIDTQIEQTLKSMPKDAGYDFDKIRAEAKRQAYSGMLDENGKYNLSQIDKIDPTKNYAIDIVKNNPELVTNMKGWDKYLKELPKSDTEENITRITGPGTSTKTKVNAKLNYFEQVERDAKGTPIGITPRYETLPAVDESGRTIPGKVVTDPDTGKPMRLLSTPLFNDLLAKRPDLADALRGETRRHFAEAGSPDIAENDPKYKAYAQHLAYQAMAQNQNSTFHTTDEEKQSAAAAKQDEMNDPQYWKNLRRETLTRKQAEVDVENADRAAHPDRYTDKTPRSATSETIANIFTNPKSIVGGEDATTTPDGKQAYDITAGFPKVGPGYVKQFYDPKSHQILMYKKGATKPEIVTAEDAGPFMTKIAMLNKESPAAVKKVLTDNNYASGGFKSGASDELAAPVIESEKVAQKATTDARNKAIDAGDVKSLANMKTPDGGKIVSVEKNILPWKPDFSVTVKDKNGVVVKKDFKTKEDLKAYMTPAEDLINKYKK